MSLTEIPPISNKEREANPQVVYQVETGSPFDVALCLATYQALRVYEQPVVFDFDNGKKFLKQSLMTVTLRTGVSDRKQMAFLGTVFQGLHGATRYRLGQPAQHITLDHYYESAVTVARTLLSNFYQDPQTVEAFREYYSGLRWGTDQERFVRSLFTYGTPYDEKQIEGQLSTSLLNSVAYGLDLPYEIRRKWYDLTPQQILTKNKDLDFRNLRNPHFAQSEKGQRLQKAYAQALGEEYGRHYFSGRREITETGKEMARPVIPLSAFPIIEALVCFDISVDKPRAKYDFGPTEAFDLIAHSDSSQAHQSLVRLLTTRLTNYKEPGMFYEGQGEFEHKRQGVWSLLRAYKEYGKEQPIHMQLTQDLAAIADEYWLDWPQLMVSTREQPVFFVERDSQSMRSICQDLLTVCLSSGDELLTGRAFSFIEKSLRYQKTPTQAEAAIFLSTSKLAEVVFDALEDVSAAVDPALFKNVATKIFGNPEIGRAFAGFIDYIKQANELRNRPEVLKALVEWRKYDFGIDEKAKRMKTAARETYYQKLKPATELYEQLRIEKNQLILTLLKDIAKNGHQSSYYHIFDVLVKRVSIANSEMVELPKHYFDLIEIARSNHLSGSERNTILYHIAASWRYVLEESQHVLVPVILDIYKVVLGELGSVRMPEAESSFGIGAASSLVNENRGLFKGASSEQLNILDAYGMEMQRLAKMVAANEFLTGESEHGEIAVREIHAKPEDPRKWQKEKLYNIQNVMRQLEIVSNFYEEYLQIEAVKVKPHIYYPWLLSHLAPFWQKMQGEVSPGEQPRRDVKDLYQTLKLYIRQKLVIQDEYPESFDVLGEGNLDKFLFELWRQMIVPHDIKYNGTVWKEGMSFMHYAVAYMPETLLKQMVDRYPGSGFAAYLQKEWAYWHKE